MSKLYLILIILTITITSAWSQPVSDSASKDSKIMIVNVYSKPIFIQVETIKDGAIFETNAIAPKGISRMANVSKTGNVFVNFKYNKADDWTACYDKYDDDVYMVDLKAGYVSCIIVDGSGEIDDVSLELPESTLPLVCFCNISGTQMTRMEIGTDYMNDYVACAADIEALGMTNFIPIDPGSYGLCWESIASTAKDEFTWLPDDNDPGLMRLLPFENNRIYVFTVFNTDGKDAALLDVTP